MIFREIITNPLLTAFTAFILATVVVVSLTLGSYGYGGNFLENILVEAHGMLLDILVIGIFILWLNRLGEKRLEIRRYREEIDDFRGWDSDEAGYRIAGNIKRLNRNGITNIRLEQCHLVKVNLQDANLSHADLRDTNLSYADLRDANLSHADLRDANLSHADLRDANLSHADLRDANLEDANLSLANLEGAYLIHADLSYANLSLANLEGANLSLANLSGANLSLANLEGACLLRTNLSDANLEDTNLIRANLGDADLSGAKGWTIEQLSQAAFLVGATLPDRTVLWDEEVWEESKKRYRQSP